MSEWQGLRASGKDDLDKVEVEVKFKSESSSSRHGPEAIKIPRRQERRKVRLPSHMDLVML